jgi:hypothetical protein
MDHSHYFAAQIELLKAISSISAKESHFSPLDELDEAKYHQLVHHLKQEADKILKQSIPSVSQLEQEKRTLEQVREFLIDLKDHWSTSRKD